MIYFFAEDISFDLKDKRKYKDWIKRIAFVYQRQVGEINYIFCSDAYLLEINQQYLDHHYFTDIITFDQADEDSTTITGDIYISIDRVKENATDLQIPFLQELNRVIIHGILHLCGMRDKAPEEEQKMREAEDQALLLFK